MPDYFRCDNCDLRLLPASGARIDVLRACPVCGAQAWVGVVDMSGGSAISSSARGQLTVAVGTVSERDDAMPITPEKRPARAAQIPIEIRWPTDEELDEFDVKADSIVLGLVFHAPVADDPDEGWICELMIQGTWDHLFRVGRVPEDMVADAMVRFAELLPKWWAEVQARRQAGSTTLNHRALVVWGLLRPAREGDQHPGLEPSKAASHSSGEGGRPTIPPLDHRSAYQARLCSGSSHLGPQ